MILFTKTYLFFKITIQKPLKKCDLRSKNDQKSTVRPKVDFLRGLRPGPAHSENIEVQNLLANVKNLPSRAFGPLPEARPRGVQREILHCKIQREISPYTRGSLNFFTSKLKMRTRGSFSCVRAEA